MASDAKMVAERSKCTTSMSAESSVARTRATRSEDNNERFEMERCEDEYYVESCKEEKATR